jgi:hypothetical protein
MTSVYVSIGRNVGCFGPMNTIEWELFRADVATAVSQYAGPVLSETVGRGEWEGVAEDCAIIVGGSSARRGALERELSRLAYRFRQEAIALTYGTPIFVEPAQWLREVEQ